MKPFSRYILGFNSSQGSVTASVTVVRLQVIPHLEVLEVQAALVAGVRDTPGPPVMDPLEFVDCGCNQFLAELSLATTAFTATFTNPGTGRVEVAAARRLEEWGVSWWPGGGEVALGGTRLGPSRV